MIFFYLLKRSKKLDRAIWCKMAWPDFKGAWQKGHDEKPAIRSNG